MTKIEVLQNCMVIGNSVKLPSSEIKRSVLVEVSKALNSIGGKWQGGKFVFNEDPTEALNKISGDQNIDFKIHRSLR
jgi:hypothetical protein